MPVRLMAYDQKYSINGDTKKRVIYFHHFNKQVDEREIILKKI